MNLLLDIVVTFVVAPFLTYWAIGFYVKVRMALHGGFKLWGGLLDFQAIDMPDGMTNDTLMDHMKDYLDDNK